MQKTKSLPRQQTLNHNCTSNKPTCFFCNTTIKPGEEIITRKTTCYHRACYETLFTLKAHQIQIENPNPFSIFKVPQIT